ncbi:hypothetical protein H6P81_017780 [Aristolochia fimbriata]|uniref:Uncharacterized protein n=1 Tax=Aristolochia fimbriata TaxID=158543 RepID=A0AAV7E213_ARIFI|nr:hypothetical protein H6P81_017780 [Aristolochia fimbriata]
MSHHQRKKSPNKNVMPSPLEVAQQKCRVVAVGSCATKNVAPSPLEVVQQKCCAVVARRCVTKMSRCRRRRKSCDNDRRTIAGKLLTKKPSD